MNVQEPHLITPTFQQPKYTTAGTLYNPSSSQPLQPPSRRGRNNKNWNGHGQAALTLFPKFEIVDLSHRLLVDRHEVYHQYSPLQQNYDRAVSPGSSADPGKNRVTMSSSSGHLTDTRLPIENIPAYALGRETANGENTINFAESDDESDRDYGSNPLGGMTVKSLQNLASYPNPSQKKAQKALLRGTRASLPLPIRINVQEQQQYGLTGQDRPSQGQPGDIVQPEERPAIWDYSPSTLRRRFPPGLSVRDDVVDAYMAAGGGAPKPIEAGPPGKRQYIPSTFESTFKALGSKAGLQTANIQPGASGEIENRQDAPGNESRRLTSLLHDAPVEEARVGRRFVFNYKGIIAPKDRDDLTSRTISPMNILDVGLRQGKGMQVEEMGRKFASWRDAEPHPKFQCEPGTSRLSAGAKQLRTDETDRIWYAGAGLSNTVTANTTKNSPYGNQSLGSETREYTPITIVTTNERPGEECTDCLLDNALATLERCSKEAWFQDILAGYN